MVRDAAALGAGQLGGADVHAAVDLHRVGVDDLAAEPLGEVERQAGLAGRGRPDDGDDRRDGRLGHGAQSGSGESRRARPRWCACRSVREDEFDEDYGPDDDAPPYWFPGNRMPDEARRIGLTHHVPDGALLDFAGRARLVADLTHRVVAWVMLASSCMPVVFYMIRLVQTSRSTDRVG